MAEILLFDLKIFTLGFSVVLVVLFALYGLTAFYNRLTLPVLKKEEPPPRPGADTDEGLTPQMAAAVAAAISYHRAARFDRAPLPLQELRLPQAGGSRWQAAGREELARKSLEADLSRRKPN